jgi:hypothetical protein
MRNKVLTVKQLENDPKMQEHVQIVGRGMFRKGHIPIISACSKTQGIRRKSMKKLPQPSPEL